MKAEFILFCIGCVAFGHVTAHLMRRRRLRRRKPPKTDDAFSGLGFSVETDCRGCGKVNRVPAHRLRDHPKCGGCKVRLMPRNKIVVCHVTKMSGSLRLELDEVWNDEERLWQSLSDHVILQAKSKAEEQDPSLRTVN